MNADNFSRQSPSLTAGFRQRLEHLDILASMYLNNFFRGEREGEMLNQKSCWSIERYDTN